MTAFRIVLLAVGLFLASAFVPLPNNKSAATVNQVQGVYVFILATPANDYEVLGTVKKTGFVMNGSAKEMVKIITKRAKDDYPNCEAVIFDDISLEHATCIRFK